MKTVRFSKVVEKAGKPEVYLLLTETDPVFQKALDAGKIMSLSSEASGAGTESGAVGYDKKRHGQLLLFPRSLKAFANSKVVGIKYDLLAENGGGEESSISLSKSKKKVAKKASVKSRSSKEEPKSAKKKASKALPQKVIPFPTKAEPEAPEEDDHDDDLKSYARQAMRALEKGNSVAAYNLLKRIVPHS